MPDYVSATDAAKALNRSESFIRRRIKTGEITARKVNGRWAVDLCELDDYRADPSDEPSTISDEPSTVSGGQRRTVDDWRDDLLAQVARLEADKVEMHEEAGQREEALREDVRQVQQEMGLRIEASKARVVDLERAATVREGRIADMEIAHADVLAAHAAEVADLRGQVAVLEAKVRETLEAHTEKLGDLASDIAELANAKAQMEVRVYELEPVAEQVPMLQAAVEEKDASLSERERELGNMRQDIDAIASRPVTGPVFRLLTKGKLRR